MALAEQSLGTFFTESNLGRSLTIDAKDKPISQIGAQLHRHDVRIRPLRRKYQGDAGGTRLHAKPAHDIRHRVGIVAASSSIQQIRRE